MLGFRMPGQSYQGPFQALDDTELSLREDLKNLIVALAGDIGVRNLKKVGSLAAALEVIKTYAERFKNMAFSEQDYSVNGEIVKNLIFEKKGQESPEEIIVIGAHYDTVFSSPGADDNASGVAAMLVIAQLLSSLVLKRTVRFLAFVNEEPPYFFTAKMGSYQYARLCRKNKDKIVAMFSLESIGYYLDTLDSQAYPFPFQFFYPTQANFIGFVGNMASKRLVQRSIDSFRKNTNFPSQGIFAPFFIPGVSLSDQLSFWRQGYKAVMITGTAYLRNPHYHQFSDIPATLNYEAMARVVLGLSKVFVELSNTSVLSF